MGATQTSTVFILLWFYTLVGSVFADSPGLYFEKILGGSGWDVFENVQVTADGGYVFTGTTETGTPLQKRLWVLRLDSMGNPIFEKTLGGHAENTGFCVRQTRDGGYVIAAQTSTLTRYKSRYGEPLFHHRAQILRLNAEGELRFEKTWGNGVRDQAHWVEEGSDFGYLVVGTLQGRFYLGSLLADGQRNWEKVLGGQSGRGLCLSQFPTGQIIAVGALGESGHEEAWIQAFSISGKPLWERRFRPGSQAVAQTVAVAKGLIWVGGYFIGRSLSPRAFVLKLGKDGKLLREFSARTGTQVQGIAVAESALAVAGILESKGQKDDWILQLDLDLNPGLERVYGGTGWDSAKAVDFTSRGEIVLTGLTRSGGEAIRSSSGHAADAWILKLDTLGRTRELWIQEEFQKTRKSRKTRAYQAFLESFPGSKYQDEAQAYLQEEGEYKRALKTGLVEEMEAFLRLYPKTRHRGSLLTRLLEFYQAQNLVPGYLHFCSKFPENRASMRALAVVYDRVFQRAKSTPGFKALEEYQRIFRFSPHFQEAERLIYPRELRDMRERVAKLGGLRAAERIAAMKTQEAIGAAQAGNFWIANRKYRLAMENPPFSTTSVATNRIHNERLNRIQPFLHEEERQRRLGIQALERLLKGKKEVGLKRTQEWKLLLGLHFRFLKKGDLLPFNTPSQRAKTQYSLFMPPKDQDHCQRAPRWLCYD